MGEVRCLCTPLYGWRMELYIYLLMSFWTLLVCQRQVSTSAVVDKSLTGHVLLEFTQKEKENPWHTVSYNNHPSFVNTKDSQVSWWKREPLVLCSGIYDGMSTRRSGGPQYTLMIHLWVPHKATSRRPHSSSISVRERNLFGSMTGYEEVEVFRGKTNKHGVFPLLLSLFTCTCLAWIDTADVVVMHSKRPQVLQQTEGFTGFWNTLIPLEKKLRVYFCFCTNGIHMHLVYVKCFLSAVLI